MSQRRVRFRKMERVEWNGGVRQLMKDDKGKVGIGSKGIVKAKGHWL